MRLTFKQYDENNRAFLHQLIEESPDWQEEECTPEQLPAYITKYEMMNGRWFVWFDDHVPVGMTFTVDWAPSNEKAWIGTILVSGKVRRRGYGAAIIEELASGYKQKGHDVLFAAVPLERLEWLRFLTACRFEQLKIEDDEEEKQYMVLVMPLT